MIIYANNQVHNRIELTEIVTKGTAKAWTILRANILLASDRNGKRYMIVAEII